jgi:hypothetical protein
MYGHKKFYKTSPAYPDLVLRHAINSKVQNDINAVLKILAFSINLKATISRKNWGLYNKDISTCN